MNGNCFINDDEWLKLPPESRELMTYRMLKGLLRAKRMDRLYIVLGSCLGGFSATAIFWGLGFVRIL